VKLQYKQTIIQNTNIYDIYAVLHKQFMIMISLRDRDPEANNQSIITE